MNTQKGHIKRSVGVKALSFALALALVLGLVPAVALGGDEQPAESASAEAKTGQEGEASSLPADTTVLPDETDPGDSSSPDLVQSLGTEVSSLADLGNVGTQATDEQLEITLSSLDAGTQLAGYDNQIRLGTSISDVPGGYVMIVPILSTGENDYTSTRVGNTYTTAVEYVGINYLANNARLGAEHFDGEGRFILPNSEGSTLDNALLIWVPTTGGTGSFTDFRIFYTFPNGKTAPGDSINIKAYIYEAEGVSNYTMGTFLSKGGWSQSENLVSLTAQAPETWNASKSAVTQTMSDFAPVDFTQAKKGTLPNYTVSYTVQANSSMSSGSLGRLQIDEIVISDTLSWTTPAWVTSSNHPAPVNVKPTKIEIRDGGPTGPVVKTIKATDITTSPFTFSWTSSEVDNWSPVSGYFANRSFTVLVSFDQNQFVQFRESAGGSKVGISELATADNQAQVTYYPSNDYKGGAISSATTAAAATETLSFGWKQSDPVLPSLTIDKYLKISGVERAYTADLGNKYEEGTSYAVGDNSLVQFSLTPVDPQNTTTPTGETRYVNPTFDSSAAPARAVFEKLEPGTYRLKENVGIPEFQNTADQAALAGAGVVVVVTPPDEEGASSLLVNGVSYGSDTSYKVINETLTRGSVKIYTKQQQANEYPTSYAQYDTVFDPTTPEGRLAISATTASMSFGTEESYYNYVLFENVPVGNYTLVDNSTLDHLVLNGLLAGKSPNGPGDTYASGNIPGFAVQVSSSSQNAYTAYYDFNQGGLRVYKKFYDPAGNEVTVNNFSATYRLYADAGLTQLPAWAQGDESLAEFTITQAMKPQTDALDDKLVVPNTLFEAGTYYLKEVDLSITNPAGEAVKYELDTTGSVKVTIVAGSLGAAPVPTLGISNARVDERGNLRNLSDYGQIAIKNFNNDGTPKAGADQQFTLSSTDAEGQTLYWKIDASGHATSSTAVQYNTVSDSSGITRAYVPAGTYTVAPAYAPAPSNGISAGQVLAKSHETVTVQGSTLADPEAVSYSKGTGFSTNIATSQTAAFAWQNLPKVQIKKVRSTGLDTASSWTANTAKFTLWALEITGYEADGTPIYGSTYTKTNKVYNVGSNGILTTGQLGIGRYLLIESALPHTSHYVWPDYLTGANAAVFAGTTANRTEAENALTSTDNDNLLFEITADDLKDSSVKTIDRFTVFNTPKNTLILTKVDAKDSTPLNGAQFTLYSNAACSQVIGTPVTTAGVDSHNNARGTASFTDLAPGEYYLKETAAPAGYSANPTVIKISINTEGWPTVDTTFSGGTATHGTKLGATVASNGLSGTGGTQNVTALTVGNVKRAEVLFQKTGETDEFDAAGVSRQREPLPGAEFTLHDKDNYYWSVDATTGLATRTDTVRQTSENADNSGAPTFTSGSGGWFNINGLDPSKAPYIIEEVDAPLGPGDQEYVKADLAIKFNVIREDPGNSDSAIIGYEAYLDGNNGSAREQRSAEGALEYIEVINKLEPHRVHLAKLPVVQEGVDDNGNAVMKVDRRAGDPAGADWASQLSAVGAQFVLYKESPSGSDNWIPVSWLETGTGDNWPANDAWSCDLPLGNYRLVETKKPIRYTPNDPSNTEEGSPAGNYGYVYTGDGDYYNNFPESDGNWEAVPGNTDGTISFEFKIEADDPEVKTVIVGNTGRPGGGGDGTWLLTRYISLFGEKDGYSMNVDGVSEFEGALANVDFNMYPAYKDASGRYHVLPTISSDGAEDVPLVKVNSASLDATSRLDIGQFYTGWFDAIQTFQYEGSDWELGADEQTAVSENNPSPYTRYEENKQFIEGKLGADQDFFLDYRANPSERENPVRVDWSRVDPAIKYAIANSLVEWDFVIKEVGGLPSNYASANTGQEFGFTITRAAGESTSSIEVQYYGNGNSIDGTTPEPAPWEVDDPTAELRDPAPYYLNNYRGEGFVSLDKWNKTKNTRYTADNGATIELWRLDPSVIDLLPDSGKLSDLSDADYQALIAGASYYKEVTSNGQSASGSMRAVSAYPGYYLARETSAPDGYNTFGSFKTTFYGPLLQGNFNSYQRGPTAFDQGDFFGPIVVLDAGGNSANKTVVQVDDYTQPTVNIKNYWNGAQQSSSSYAASYNISSSADYALTQKTSTGTGAGAAGALAQLPDGTYTIDLSAKTEPSSKDDYMPNPSLYNDIADGGLGNKLTFEVKNGVALASSVKVGLTPVKTTWGAADTATEGVRMTVSGSAVTNIEINHPSRAAVLIFKGVIDASGTAQKTFTGLDSATFSIAKKTGTDSWGIATNYTWNVIDHTTNGLRIPLSAGTYKITEESISPSPNNLWAIDTTPVYVEVGDEGLVYLKNATETSGTESHPLKTTSTVKPPVEYFNNDSLLGNFQIKKLANASGNLASADLRNAKFEVYKDNNGELGEFVTEITYKATAPTGYFVTLPAGDYLVLETKAPDGGYAKRTEPVAITVLAMKKPVTTGSGSTAVDVNWIRFVDPVTPTLKVAKVTTYGDVGISGQPGYIPAHKVKLAGIQMYLWKRIPGTSGTNAHNFELVGSMATVAQATSTLDVGEAGFTITEEGEYLVTEALYNQDYVNLNAAYGMEGFSFTGTESPADPVTLRGDAGITLGDGTQEPLRYVFNEQTGKLEIQTQSNDWSPATGPYDAPLKDLLAVNNSFNGYVIVAEKFDARTGQLVTGNRPGATYGLYATEEDALKDQSRLQTKSDPDGVGYVLFEPGYAEQDDYPLTFYVRELSAPNGYTLDPWYELPIQKVTIALQDDQGAALVNPAVAEFRDGPLDEPSLSVDKDVEAGKPGYLTTEPAGTPDRVAVEYPLAQRGFETVYTIAPKTEQQNNAPLYNYRVSDGTPDQAAFTFFGGSDNSVQVLGPTYHFTKVEIDPSVAYASYQYQWADRDMLTGIPSGANRSAVYARVNGGDWVQLSKTEATTLTVPSNKDQYLNIEYTVDPQATVPYVGTWFSAGALRATVQFDAFTAADSTQPDVSMIKNTVTIDGQKRSYGNTDLSAPTYTYTDIKQASSTATILIDNPERPVMKVATEVIAPGGADKPLVAGEKGRLKFRISLTNDVANTNTIDNPVLVDYLHEALTLNTVESIVVTQGGTASGNLVGDDSVVHTAVNPQVHRWAFEGLTLEPGDKIEIEFSTDIAAIVSSGKVSNEAYGTSTTWFGALYASSRYPAGASFIGEDMKDGQTPAGSLPGTVWSGNAAAAESWTKLTSVGNLEAQNYGLFIRAEVGDILVSSGGMVYNMKSVKVGDGGYTSSKEPLSLNIASEDSVTYRLTLQNSQPVILDSDANKLANLRIADIIPFPGDSRETGWDPESRNQWKLDTSSFVVQINGQPVPQNEYTIYTDSDPLLDQADETARIAAYQAQVFTPAEVGANDQISADATSFIITFGSPLSASKQGDNYTDDGQRLLSPNDVVTVEYTMRWSDALLADAQAVADVYRDNNLKVATNDFYAFYNPLVQKSSETTDALVLPDKDENSSTVSVQIDAPRVDISGIAWEDKNYNGLQDNSETPLQGVPVSLWKQYTEMEEDDSGVMQPVVRQEEVTTNASGVPYDASVFTTQADGSYCFADLQSSYQTGITYEVRFGLPDQTSGWVRTAQQQGADGSIDSDAADDTSTTPGHTGWFVAETNADGTANAPVIANIDAGYYLLSSIEGWVWDDYSADGIQGAAEKQGRKDVNVYLYASLAEAQAGSTTIGVGGLLAQTSTGATGAYSFTGLQARDEGYFLRFDKSNAETATQFFKWSPELQGSDPQVDSDPKPWDGTAFIAAAPDYTVPTGDYAANVAITQNAVVVSYNNTSQHVDAGLVPIAKTISVYVWEDQNYDGYADAAENGIAGVALVLEQSINNGNWTEYATATTGSSGRAEFTGPDTDPQSGVIFGADYRYRVKVALADNDSYYSPKTSTAPGTSAADSDVNGTNPLALDYGYTDVISEPTANIGSGQYQLGYLSGKVWFDTSRDGIQNDLPGTPHPVTTTLFRVDSDDPGSYQVVETVASSTTTATTADYRFDQLPSGYYVVQFDRSNLTADNETYGWTSGFVGADRSKDSDAVPLSPLSPLARTLPITVGYVTADQQADKYTDGTLNAVDAGIVKNINTVSGKVWNDENYDGLQNDSEVFVGAKVELYRMIDGQSAYTLFATTATNSQGVYTFDNNGAGISFADNASYYVKVYKPQGDYVFTKRVASGLNSDVDVNGISDAFDYKTPNASIDAGIYQTLSISGVVWFDYDDDGIRNDIDGIVGSGRGVDGLSLALNGTDDTGSPVNLTTTSGANGAYAFEGLKSGSYTVTVTNSIDTANRSYKWSLAGAGSNRSIDSDVTGISSVGLPDARYNTAAATQTLTLEKNASLTSVDAGIVPYVHVRGFVWTDTNRDGVKNNAEQYRDGVIVTLHSNESGVFAPVSGASMSSGSGGTAGYYEFDELLLDPDVNVKVVFSNPDYTLLRWSVPGTDHTATDLRGAHSENSFYYDEAHTAVKNLSMHEHGWNAGLQGIPSYTVTYAPNGGTGSWGTSGNHTQTVKAGSLVPSQSVSRGGYTFTGWFLAPSETYAWGFAYDRMPENNITLVAHWALIPTYGVYYNANGGSGAVPGPDTGYYSGQTATVLLSPTPSLSGYTFGGWATTPNGITPVSSVTFSNANINLYAIWIPIPTYTVTYDANGGVGTQVDGTAYTAGSTVTLLGQGTVTRAGYTFMGWSLTPDGPVISDFVITGNTTVYAIWQMDEDVVTPPPPAGPTQPTPSESTPPSDPFEDLITSIFGDDIPQVNLFGNDIPLAAIGYDAWALVNLILTIMGVLFAALMVVLYLKKRRVEEDEDEALERRIRLVDAETRGEEYEEEPIAKKKRLVWRIIAAVLAVVAVILFVLTEDMSLPMVLIDQWTLVHAIIFVVLIACCIVAAVKKKVQVEDTEEEMEEARQALAERAAVK